MDCAQLGPKAKQRAQPQQQLHPPRAVEMHMDIPQEQFYANLQGNAGAHDRTRAADFVRACAVEMHMTISQEQFYARIYSKNAGGPESVPLSNPGLNPYR